MPWQPISTAPHDYYTQVWLRAPGIKPGVYDWEPTLDRWQRGNGLWWKEDEDGPVEWKPVTECKDEGAPVGALGECLLCAAEAGVKCRRMECDCGAKSA